MHEDALRTEIRKGMQKYQEQSARIAEKTASNAELHHLARVRESLKSGKETVMSDIYAEFAALKVLEDSRASGEYSVDNPSPVMEFQRALLDLFGDRRYQEQENTIRYLRSQLVGHKHTGQEESAPAEMSARPRFALTRADCSLGNSPTEDLHIDESFSHTLNTSLQDDSAYDGNDRELQNDLKWSQQKFNMLQQKALAYEDRVNQLEAQRKSTGALKATIKQLKRQAS
jgi:hypothetical protein